MSESGSSANSSTEGLSAVLASDKCSRNKRKFKSDLSRDIPAEEPKLSLTEFPRYEEKSESALNELGSTMEKSEDGNEEQEVEEYQDTDWDHPIAGQLEELLTKELFATFRGAVKKIIELGYTEEAAEWAVLSSSLFHGIKDAVSNVVDGALALLKREKELDTPKNPVFEGMQSLVDYTLLEMIHVLREVRPTLTVTEAMWCLLISDLNLLNACVLEVGPPGGGSRGLEASRESLTLSKSISRTSGTGPSDPRAQSSQPETPVAGPARQEPSNKAGPGELASLGKEKSFTLQEAKGKFSSRGMVADDKSGGSKSGSSANSKRDMFRQKGLHSEKNYKGRMSKGAFKAKVAALGSMVLDKSLKSQSDSSSLAMKGTFSKLTTSSSSGPSSLLTVDDDPPVFGLPAVNSVSLTSSVPDNDPRPEGEINVSHPPKVTDYYASIPFDETLQKYVPQDDKDETILMLVPHMKALERELQGWMDWANEKVMQAARRLGKDREELKKLRQEKEEMEKLNKEKQSLEENTIKRLSEMEQALTNATGQIEVGNCSVRRLEEENTVLKKEMEAAKSRAIGAATNLQQAMLREQDALKKLQSWETEKCLVLEQLTNLKCQIAELVNQLEKVQERQNQFKVLLKQEEKEKLKVAAQINSIRSKSEEEDASMKAEAESIIQTAKANMQKCKDDIKNLENMISELRLESDKSKIAALNVGYGSCLAGVNVSTVLGRVELPKINKRLAVFKENFGAGDVKPERECVMCMTDERSVVFLPCAHQVLCEQCNVLHEKKAMNECPSCRTIIQKRISVSHRVE